MWRSGATMFAECQEEAGGHGASARHLAPMWNLCRSAAGILSQELLSWLIQLWLKRHPDLSKHTRTTHLPPPRGTNLIIL